MIGLVVLLALTLIGTAVAYMIIASGGTEDDPRVNVNGRPNASPSASASPAPSASPGGGTTGRADMVMISGGSFQMGRTGGSPGETPAHPVSVAPFHIDRTEVTNTEYAEFVRATNRTPPGWPNQNPPAGREQWPVTDVSFDDAVAFAAWRSERMEIAVHREN